MVVTNHALLAIDALSDVSVLPEHDVVVIDEAHELDGRITAVASAEITVNSLNLAARRASSWIPISGKNASRKSLAIWKPCCKPCSRAGGMTWMRVPKAHWWH